MKLLSAALALAFLVASPEIRYFRYERPIQVPVQQAGQACLSIDPEIFVHAAPQLADLRLYANSTETPYTIRLANSLTRSEEIPLLNAGVRDKQTVFDAEMPDMHYSDLQLAVTAQNFIATVTVTGTKEKSGKPETKLGDFTIFDLSRQRLGRSTVLHLPDSSFPYLHFRIAGPLRPEDVTGLSVEHTPTQLRYRTVAETTQVVQKDHATIIEFTMPAHMPVARVVIMPGDTPAAFSRDVTVTATEVIEEPASDQQRPPFVRTTTGNLLRIHKVQDGRRIDEERLSIEAPSELEFGAERSRWTITIANGDDRPISLKSVRLEMRERALCFDAAANAAYTLYYGDSALASPQYDFALLFNPQASALQVTAGAEQLNPGWQPRPDDRPFTERHRALLWVALVAVIALLAAIALKSQKLETKAT
jgi:hypothetical protein